MNLILDIGNTRIKCATFQHDQLLDLVFFSADDYQACKNHILTLEATDCILSTTQKEQEEFNEWLASHFPTIQLDYSTPLPISVSYLTPKTLGDDRIAAVCGAISITGHQPCMVISAGTCITYNYFDGKSFVGGSISPGIQMRYQAMHSFTGKLPMVENMTFDALVGRTTQESLISGVRKGIVAEVDGIIEDYRLLQPNIKVFLCGGDTFFFESRVKSEIFAHSNLVLHGLNHILEYNKSV